MSGAELITETAATIAAKINRIDKFTELLKNPRLSAQIELTIPYHEHMRTTIGLGDEMARKCVEDEIATLKNDLLENGKLLIGAVERHALKQEPAVEAIVPWEH